MQNETVKGLFNINGTVVKYDYDLLENKLEKTSIAREYSNTDTYDIDEYVIYNGKMYRCKQKILVGESFDPTKWSECSVGTELNYIKWLISDIQIDSGNLPSSSVEDAGKFLQVDSSGKAAWVSVPNAESEAY